MGKKKNADFQKVKFKVGKRLPKGTNVTDTSFKAKKIVIRNQLRTDADSVGNLTNKKPTVKDYLSRLENFRPTTRDECLVGLKDILARKPDAILPNLGGILEKAGQLMVDRYPRVRENVVSLLSLVFTHVSSTHITPFFTVITSYLSCAMTHIIPDIRESSLNYVDLVLEKYPEQTVTVGSQILQNFLEQISVERDSSTGLTIRTLAITPSSHLSSQVWRMSVLDRMEKFLSAAIYYWKSKDNKEIGSKVKEIYWDGNTPLYVPIYNTGPFQPKLLEPQFTLNLTDPFALHDNSLRDSKILQSFMSVIVPLLKETWLEAQPNGGVRKGNINKALADTMYVILQVAYLLGEWAEIVDNDNKDSKNLQFFQEVFTKDFLMHYMINFPYSFFGTPLTKGNKEEKKSNLTVNELNLTLCKLYSVTLSELKKIKNMMGHSHDKVVDYLTYMFQEEEIHGSKNMETALKTVKRMIDYNIEEDFCHKLNVGLYSLCQNWKSNPKEREPVFNYFLDLCLLPKYRPFLSSQPVKAFLESLPKELISQADNKDLLMILLNGISKIAPKRYQPFGNSLQENDTAIIDLLQQIPCTEQEQLTIQRNLIELILAIPQLNLNAFRRLSEILRLECVSIKNVNYFLQVLSFRCLENKNLGFDHGHFLSLLLCLQFGISQSENPILQEKYESNRDWSYFRNNTPEISHFTILPSETEAWEKHMLLTEDVCQLLMQFPDINDVDKATENYLNKLLSSCQFLPIHCVAGILNMAAALHFAVNKERSLNSDLNFLLVELALAGLVMCVLNLNLPEKLAAQYRCEEFLEIMFGFINNKECTDILCQVLLKQIEGIEALSDGETDCIGLVIVQIIKNAELQKEQRQLIAKTMRKLATTNSTQVKAKRWYREACYELETQYNQDT